MFKTKEDDEIVVEKNKTLIVPLRDFRIVHNDVDIQLLEGVEVEIDNKFIENLKTEKVIKGSM